MARQRTGTRALPRLWLFTGSEPGGEEGLLASVRALPRGSGIVWRLYAAADAQRRALLGRLRPLARRRRLLLLVALPWPGARADGADGVHLARFRHLPRRRRFGLVSAGAGSRRELLAAFAAGADLVFLSPVFATSSHPGARVLGPLRFGLACRGAPGPVVPLGGMTAGRAPRLAALGGYGFAAISALRAASPSSTKLTRAESSNAKSISPARAITSRAEGTT